MSDERDERGVRLDAAFYPHTILCIRRSASLTNPQSCNCGGNELIKKTHMHKQH